MNVTRRVGASTARRCGSGAGLSLEGSQTNVILVTGTGFCHPAALCYYAPLLQSIGPAELHTLEHWGFGFTERSVDRLIRHLEKFDAPATLIGHSQGGLVAALTFEAAPSLVRQVVTVCAPLRGTAWAPAWAPIPSARDMSRARRSRQSWQAASLMVNVVAANDRVVIPYQSGLLDGAEHHVISGVGHSGIIWDARLHRVVSEVLRRPAFREHDGENQGMVSDGLSAVA
jgi:pimeloyl-ACP methyl ester carboxylesterase